MFALIVTLYVPASHVSEKLAVYWKPSGDKETYSFHPQTLGVFLEQLPCDEVGRYLNAAIGMADTTPNGGLLWYYPDNFKLSRFLGPDISPSALAQGQILGAITHLDARCDVDLEEVANKVFLGLEFDYYQGGANLGNKALLELPLFRSAPEIVLNGWLTALLHLKEYAQYYQNPDAQALFSSNIEFLTVSLPSFNDDATGLSRYSDLSPYRVRVEQEGAPLTRLVVYYPARMDGLEDMAFNLGQIEQETQSPYDNQIISQSDSQIDVWISCSQHYDTYLISAETPFSVSFATGTYNPYETTPEGSGEALTISSTLLDGYHVANITEVRNDLICGYPTNFAKRNANYYHSYHIVALACLLTTSDLPAETREVIYVQIREWMQAADDLAKSNPEELQFADYDYVLKSLSNQHLCNGAEDWATLLKMVEERAE